ncbi:LacI family DNA-binding transcriptional regulator [Thermoactinospora rubra]|uniref:LacI family DNA-binding transcriptional regulator n=1 Tax=Thermoactinospora rubra TaxID=1088767 RepID=UPI000A11DCA6|nr:LacI family DNA-binding transcriptional regulator [Thermoactinospora rubra]
MPKKKPTIADVARRAGVSKGAVSLTLNNRPGISQDTRERILSAAAELNWQPDRRGRSLAASRAFALGLVIARPPRLLEADPFFPAFIAGVEAVLAEREYTLVLQVVRPGQAEADAYRNLARGGRVDGVFLSDLRHADPRLQLLAEVGLPAVTLNRPDVRSPFPAVCLDDGPGIAAAVRHLVELGHTRIAHVSGPSRFLHGAGRARAWRQALAEAGLPPGPVVESDFSAAGGAAATRELLAGHPRPTAIVYANDLMAIAGQTAARAMGLSVPEDLSVTGFDDCELAAYMHPPLTTVATNAFGWGKRATAVLLDLIEGEEVADVELPPTRLVLRGSTAPPS